MTPDIRTSLVLCNLCGSAHFKTLFSARDRLYGLEGRFQYVRCDDCGLVYMNPQVIPDCISQIYPENYAQHHSSGPDRGSRRPHLPKIILNSLTPDSRVLDIGCSNGDFLHQLQQHRRCRVNGLEISENAVLLAKKQYGIDVFHGDIFSAPYEKKSFDLITLRSVIEHISNPKGAMEKAFTLCKPSGLLFIKTPNYDSFGAKLFKDKWYPVECPRHLYLFSPSTISALLEKCGFEVLKVQHRKSPAEWLGTLQYVFYGNNFRPETKNKFRRSSLARSFVSPIAHLAALLKKADIMAVLARRPNL
jgi:2-polyprenyl-3-methyl-5-hydroxy-6-metoxy-1,4-benzoquinol methylase